MRIHALWALGWLAGVCALGTGVLGQGFPPPVYTALGPDESSAPPPIFLDHAVLAKTPDLPVLAAGALSVASAFPESGAEMEPQWDTFERGTTKRLAQFLDAGAQLDAPAGSAVTLMLAAPAKAPWMFAGTTQHGKSITVHVKSWDPPAAEAARLPSGRRAYLVSLERLAAGTYDLSLECDHYEGDAAGLYQFSGKREVATAKLQIGPNAAAPAIIRQSDLKTELVDVKAGAPEVPPLHWARHIVTPLKHDLPAFDVRIGTLDAPAALAKMPERPNDAIVPAGPAAGKAADLVACIVSPSLASGQYMALDSVSVSRDKKGCVIRVTLWRDSGGRGANVFSRTELLVPLSFLAKSEQTVTVKWQEYHADTMSKPYVWVTPPAPDATVKVSVE